MILWSEELNQQSCLFIPLVFYYSRLMDILSKMRILFIYSSLSRKSSADRSVSMPPDLYISNGHSGGWHIRRSTWRKNLKKDKTYIHSDFSLRSKRQDGPFILPKMNVLPCKTRNQYIVAERNISSVDFNYRIIVYLFIHFCEKAIFT